MKNAIYKSQAKETEKRMQRKIKRQNKIGTFFYVVAGVALFSIAAITIAHNFAYMF